VTTHRARADQVSTATPEATRAPHNPYLIALTAVGGSAWLVAFMLWVVLAQVTDYVTYDHDTAAALTAWIDLLLFAGAVAFVGSVVIAGVGYEMLRAHRE
jgi:hypothetical protein